MGEHPFRGVRVTPKTVWVQGVTPWRPVWWFRLRWTLHKTADCQEKDIRRSLGGTWAFVTDPNGMGMWRPLLGPFPLPDGYKHSPHHWGIPHTIEQWTVAPPPWAWTQSEPA